MMLVALCSGKGSPGVTTLACVVGAVWPAAREVTVAECDPSGNDLAVRFGLSPRLGMTSLVLAQRSLNQKAPALEGHVQFLPGGLGVLVGPCNPEAARMLDTHLAKAGSEVFPGEGDILIDCGRILAGSSGQTAMLKAADHVLVVVRPDSAGLAHAQRTVELVRATSSQTTCSFVVVGPSPFRVEEMERALQADLVSTVPLDDGAASVACGVPGRARALAKSRLVASAKEVADRLLEEPKSAARMPDDSQSKAQRRHAFTFTVKHRWHPTPGLGSWTGNGRAESAR